MQELEEIEDDEVIVLEGAFENEDYIDQDMMQYFEKVGGS
jgi:hypothetical protein